MLARLGALAALTLSFASAMQLETPTNVQNAGPMTLTWTSTASDPSVFSAELVNADGTTFAIANNVQTSVGQATVALPQVPAGAYTVQAVNISNVNDVFTTSGSFSISAASSSLTSSSSSSSTSSLTHSGTTSTGTASTTSTTGTSASGTTSSSGSATPTNINSSSAASLKFGVGPATAVLLGAVAGAVMMF